MLSSIYQITLLLNVLWFGSAFWYFALKHDSAAKLMVPTSARQSPLFKTFSAALPFLGGMNLALALLALMLLINPHLFAEAAEKIILLICFSIAHASQFLFNVPVALRGGRRGESYWDVLKGPMLFIFLVDALMTALNAGCALLLAT